MFSISITYHSKIRELSDENKNWKQKPNGLLSYGSHHFWVMSYENKVMSFGNNKSKQLLSLSGSSFVVVVVVNKCLKVMC